MNVFASIEKGQGATPSGSGCQPTASAVPASQSGIPSADDLRNIAQFFFEHGFWDCYAEAMVINGREPFALPDDRRIEQLWERHRDGIDAQDIADFTNRLMLANAAPMLLEALRAVELARFTDKEDDWSRATVLTDAALTTATGGAA